MFEIYVINFEIYIVIICFGRLIIKSKISQINVMTIRQIKGYVINKISQINVMAISQIKGYVINKISQINVMAISQIKGIRLIHKNLMIFENQEINKESP